MRRRLAAAVQALPCAFFLAAAPARAKAPAPRALDYPDTRGSSEAIERGLQGVAVFDGTIVSFVARKAMALRGSWTPAGKDRAARFGVLTSHERAPLPFLGEGELRGAAKVDGRYLLFDGKQMVFHEVDPQGFKPLLLRSLAWDLLRPPADRGGEATASETAEGRARFKRAMLAAPALKMPGIARVPASWGVSKHPAFFATTRLAGFPLVLLECREDEPSSCAVTRYCQLGGGAPAKAEAVAGIAVSEKRRLVLIADATQRRIVAYKFGSCYGSSRAGEWLVPPKVKTVANIHVDADDRLWLASAQPDDELDASLYVWEPEAW